MQTITIMISIANNPQLKALSVWLLALNKVCSFDHGSWYDSLPL